MTLKSKTISGFKWSLLDTVLRYFLTFFIGIILARILSPSDYGLVGMSAIFIAISRVFIDGGFSDALIRKNYCTIDDYSSVLFFNIILAFFFYIILFFSSGSISVFFNEPQLENIIKITGLGLIIGATNSIHSIYLKKVLNFKLLAQIGFLSTIISGLVSILMAFCGFAFWSIIFSGLIQSLFSSILFWVKNKELKIKISLKKIIIKEHFGFGSKIMLGSLVHVIYNNMYFALVGKIFNTSMLGYYTRADNFQKLVSDNIDIVVRQVTYPVLSQIQNEENRLKSTYKMMIRLTSFISFVLLMGLFVVSKPLILILIGEKWLPSVPYLQLLCFTGMLMPIISINTNILNVKGRSDLSLKMTMLKVFLAIPSIILGYHYGIFSMIWGMIISLIITYIIVAYFTNTLLNYSIKEQIFDVLPAVKIIVLSFSPVVVINHYIWLNNILLIIVDFMLSILFIIFFGEILKNKEYLFIRDHIKSIINKK